MDNVFVVTVTYGNRFHLLRRVIEAALREGVRRVIVVDNRSDPESRRKLREYHANNSEVVDVLYLDENYGSAGGFKRGLERAYSDPECEFIWLLDDDNMPCPGALETLQKFWEEHDLEEKENRLALLSFRESRKESYLISKDTEAAFGMKNSFYGFHVSQIPAYIKKIIFRKNVVDHDKIPDKCIIGVAPYGGLFLNKKLLDSIGYPEEELYLYSDDHEWTYRITVNRGEIILLTDSHIKDLEESWILTRENETVLSTFSPLNTFRIYYGIRNRVYFENKYLITRKYVYKVNRLIFLLLIFFHDIFFFRTTETFKTLLRAIDDGENNRLGKNELFKLD